MELRYQEFSAENAELIKELQKKIFPETDFSKGFDSLLENGPEPLGNVMQTYFIAFADDKPAGMYGLYIPDGVEEHRSIWLGWYGLLDDFRGKGIGKKILFDAFDKARGYREEYGTCYLRLYTDASANASAQPLYNKVMDLKEYYANEEMTSAGMLEKARPYFPGKTDEELKYITSHTLTIFSKRLFDDEILVPWDNRCMGFSKALEFEEVSM